MTHVVIFIGPTGSGKSVQAEALLLIHPDWRHISSGDLLRDDIAATAYIARGELVPALEVERVVATSLKAATAAPYILLDGFPRTIVQAEWLNDLFETQDMQVQTVVSFETTIEVVLNRLAERHRSDDDAAVVARKWKVYTGEVRPVCTYYREQGLLRPVNANLSVGKLTHLIEEILHV